MAGIPDALIFFCLLFFHQGKKRRSRTDCHLETSSKLINKNTSYLVATPKRGAFCTSYLVATPKRGAFCTSYLVAIPKRGAFCTSYLVATLKRGTFYTSYLVTTLKRAAFSSSQVGAYCIRPIGRLFGPKIILHI